MANIHIVDDDDSVRSSLGFMLEGYDFQVAVYASGEDFLSRVDLEQAGCVILDSSMPGLSGQQVQRILNEKESPLSVIYLTGQGDVPMAVDAFKKGAVDFFQKPVDGNALAAALEKALLLSERHKRMWEYRRLVNQLTAREKEMFSLITQGYKNQQVADKMNIAVRTVEVHRANLMKKLNAKTVSELAVVYSMLNENEVI
ncbi:DNA-binding response regulator [Leminorella grimontii]|uniref:DNA-binding response regulator n=1 Tax=Leminorella grimontii TaxID=82981 RepID=A0AAV5MYR6_9GAMM|nr:response regulator [Leminorella grimontii]KFC96356.1 tetrathionate reductase two-component response regulator [Leminorella grimontii ATCC 33999 = DSM 5078]GKX54455.1 DNA-binding response regulator [Leminorella grimontii]GKX57874.1 DNA-binding response regulator [Leminorella grimontii]VFS59227.1 Transcriptional regulatory protein fixJ [Leminorella grimontii]